MPALIDCPFDVAPIAPATAEAMRITAGIPSIPTDIAPGTFNPIEANILSAVSFDKGCYLGQEVVARVHRLGRLSTRMISATAPDGGALEAGGLTDDGNTVGALTSVVEISDTPTGIGWLKSRYSDGELALSGRTLQVVTLPPS
jgi:folate-binding protein YgfZ